MVGKKKRTGKKKKVTFTGVLRIREQELPSRYAIWERGDGCQVLNVGTCDPADFDAFVVASLDSTKAGVKKALRGIDRAKWDLDERWWVIDKLVDEEGLVLFRSQTEAELAAQKSHRKIS
jgi:hypothetical protein